MNVVARFIPALAWLPLYDRTWFSKDLLGGLTAGAVVIPQAMAYATIADLPVEVGLYTCMVPMVVYALLGGSRSLSVSTTSTVALLTASTLLAADVAAQAADPVGDLATLTLLVGLILVVFRVLRLGALIDNISEATLAGIKVGVGLTVAAGQLPKLLGITTDPDADSFFDELRAVIDNLGDVSVTTLVFSIGTVGVLLGLGSVLPRVPAPLVAVVGGIALVAVGSLDEHGLALIAPFRPASRPLSPRRSTTSTPCCRVLSRSPSCAFSRRPPWLAACGVRRNHRSTTIRSCSPTVFRAESGRSSGRCPRRVGSPRLPSTNGRAPARKSASWSPPSWPSAVPCSSARFSATSHRPRSAPLSWSRSLA